MPGLLALGLAQIVEGIKAVDELLEGAQLLDVDLLAGRFGGGSFLGVGRHTGAVEDMLFDVDGRLHAYGDGDGITGAGVKLDVAAVAVHDDASEEGLFAEVV